MAWEIHSNSQDFLAHMLGTRRATVSITAGVLQKAGLITYKRGQIEMKDRAPLERASCECYAAIKKRLDTWRKDGRSHS